MLVVWYGMIDVGGMVWNDCRYPYLYLYVTWVMMTEEYRVSKSRRSSSKLYKRSLLIDPYWHPRDIYEP